MSMSTRSGAILGSRGHKGLDKAWVNFSQCFGLGKLPPKLNVLTTETKQILVREKAADKACKLVHDHVSKILKDDIVPEFWKFFITMEDHDKAMKQFQKAVNYLFNRISELSGLVGKLDEVAVECGVPCKSFGQNNYPDLFKMMLKSTLFSQLPRDFQDVPRLFYEQGFHVFYERQEKILNANPDDSMELEDLECSGCKNETEACRCDAIMALFNEVNDKLVKLDLLERLGSHVITEIIHLRIEKHVVDTCKGNYTASFLAPLEKWMGIVVYKWIRMLYTSDLNNLSVTNERNLASLDILEKRLLNHLYEVYTKNRIEELYNIIIEFPESQPALEDLIECLNKTDLRQYLITNLTNLLKSKLHLGANTSDILIAYIDSIRALRFLDPSGVILQIACEPFRKYFRTRDDTVRCIVQSLVDDSNGDLVEELKQNDGLLLEEGFFQEESFDNWENWEPDPIDAYAEKKNDLSGGRRTSDIISMLVNIYGSKELFVEEYRNLLSNRLLSQHSYDTEKEIRNLELLKLRFGDASLHRCEVMLKDISDSKRINSALHNIEDAKVTGAQSSLELLKELKDQPFPINAVILSAQFWPQFKEENLQLPKEIEKSLSAYTKAFESMKGNRTLVWKNHLGFVSIDLEIEGRKINLEVSPVHAAIIYQFQEKCEWTIEELSRSLKLSPATLRRKISFWISKGLLKEVSTDKYVLVEDTPMRRMSTGNENHIEDEDADSVTKTSKDQREDDLQVFWTYIYSMLDNLESLPLESIHKMLKMFAIPGASGGTGSGPNCSLDEVRRFLDRKVQEQQLVFLGGKYRLPPKQ